MKSKCHKTLCWISAKNQQSPEGVIHLLFIILHENVFFTSMSFIIKNRFLFIFITAMQQIKNNRYGTTVSYLCGKDEILKEMDYEAIN